MKRLVVFVLTLAISFSTALAQEKDHEKKMQELEKKIDDLIMEIEVIKATSGMDAQKVEKFKMFGYFGMRYMDFTPDNETMFPSSEAMRTEPSFIQNNMNIYFQFNPIENWKVLSEIRFLYYPKGNAMSTSADASTVTSADILRSSRFRDFTTGEWVPNNGPFAYPISSDGYCAFNIGHLTTPLDLNGDGDFDYPAAWYPKDINGNWMLPKADGTFILLSPTGELAGSATAADIVMVKSPVVKGVSMFDNTFNTNALDPVSAINYSWGGLNIERAYMEWNYSDKLNFLGGKFLTPFGIWNVDHGLPVLLSARIPYMLAFIPDTQVGVQTFGRFNLPHTDLEYSMYVSNGRDIPSPVFDNNKEKSVGGRLNLKLQSEMFKELSIGASGYYGKHTDDVAEYKVVFDDSDFIINEDGVTNDGEYTETKLQVTQHVWSEFDEYDLGVDFKMAFKGLSLQSEFLYRSFDYTAWDQKYINQKFGSLFPPRKMPDITAFYVQTGYELPWKIKDVAITPFARYESIDGYIRGGGIGEIQGTPVHEQFQVLTGGLNLRQNPYVTYKFDYTKVQFDQNKDLGFDCITVSADIGF